MPRWNHAALLAVLCLGALLEGSQAMAAPPAINAVVPAGINPGQATDVTIYGGNLVGAAGLWCPCVASSELTPEIENNGQDAGKVTYRLNVPAETPVGVYGLRLATPEGISNLRLVLVDDLSTVNEAGNNKTYESAQAVTVPVAIEGACEPESFDCYKISAEAGQRISIEVFARRLGSPLDPVVRLLTTSGEELAYSDDVGGISGDCRLAYQFETAGDYLIEIRDISYRGGGNHRYRLRIGDFPLASVSYPLGLQRGASAPLAIVGPTWNEPRFTAAVAADKQPGPTPMGAAYPDGQGSAAVVVVASDAVENVEFEPNDSAETASPVQVPGAINGRFGAEADRDHYTFNATKGQRLVFTGQTRSLGSPADLYMHVYKPDGGQIAEVDDTGTEEGVLNVTFPEDGTYRLMVEDLNRRGGPELVYRVDVEPYEPGFSLRVEADRFNVPKGGVWTMKVISARRDYNGPINLGLEGVDGLQLSANVIAEGQNETVMRITAPASLEGGSPRILRVVGTAKVGEQDYRTVADATLPLRTELAGLPYPPASLTELVGLGIGPVFPDFFKLSVNDGAVLFPQLVGTANLKVKVERTNGFEDAVALAIEGLPPGFAVGEVKPIEKGQSEIDIALTGPVAVAEGDYPLRIRGSASFQDQPKSIVHDAVLRVAKPLQVSLAPAGPLVSGGTVKAKITVTRFGDEKQPVQVTLDNLPPGVTTPTELTVPAEATELEIDLNAASDAAVGEFKDISVIATTTVQGRTIEVASSAALQINMP